MTTATATDDDINFMKLAYDEGADKVLETELKKNAPAAAALGGIETIRRPNSHRRAIKQWFGGYGNRWFSTQSRLNA